jgi:hypothetical protein
MADPPVGAPEPPPTYTQETTASFSVEDFQPRVTVTTPLIPHKRTRSGEGFTPAEGTGRVTTQEVRQLIDTLKDTIAHQTNLIESSKAELLEVKHDQNVIKAQNEKLHEEVCALRAQIEALPSTPPARSWAAVAAGAGSQTP